MKYLSILSVLLILAGCQGTDDLILVTSVTWQPQQSGTEASLRGLSVVGSQVAWASGAGGTVLRTVDGGATWQNVSVPGWEKYDFRDIEAFDAQTAVVISIARPAKIYKTSDGGQNWTEQYSNDAPGIFFDAMGFWDADNGIAVGDPIEGKFVLITTDNRGQSWRPLPPENIPPARAGELWPGGCFPC